MTARNIFTSLAKQKYPFVHTYVDSLKSKNITEEGLDNEINSLNQCALCEDPMSFNQRLGIAFLSSLNPTTILGGALGYYFSGDQCETKYRDAENRYKEFSLKL